MLIRTNLFLQRVDKIWRFVRLIVGEKTYRHGRNQFDRIDTTTFPNFVLNAYFMPRVFHIIVQK